MSLLQRLRHRLQQLPLLPSEWMRRRRDAANPPLATPEAPPPSRDDLPNHLADAPAHWIALVAEGAPQLLEEPPVEPVAPAPVTVQPVEVRPVGVRPVGVRPVAARPVATHRPDRSSPSSLGSDSTTPDRRAPRHLEAGVTAQARRRATPAPMALTVDEPQPSRSEGPRQGLRPQATGHRAPVQSQHPQPDIEQEQPRRPRRLVLRSTPNVRDHLASPPQPTTPALAIAVPRPISHRLNAESAQTPVGAAATDPINFAVVVTDTTASNRQVPQVMATHSRLAPSEHQMAPPAPRSPTQSARPVTTTPQSIRRSHRFDPKHGSPVTAPAQPAAQPPLRRSQSPVWPTLPEAPMTQRSRMTTLLARWNDEMTAEQRGQGWNASSSW